MVFFSSSSISFHLSIEWTNWKHFSHFDCDISKEIVCVSMWCVFFLIFFFSPFLYIFHIRCLFFPNPESWTLEMNQIDSSIYDSYDVCVCLYRSASLRKMKNDFQNIIERWWYSGRGQRTTWIFGMIEFVCVFIWWKQKTPYIDSNWYMPVSMCVWLRYRRWQ